MRRAWLVVLPVSIVLAEDAELARRAQQDLFSGQFEQAAANYTKLLKDDPSWMPGYPGLVEALLRSHRAVEAYAVAAEALRRGPQTAEAQAAAGMAAWRHGDLAGAESHYREALRLDPVNLPATIGLAAIYNSVSRFASARRLLDDATRLVPPLR